MGFAEVEYGGELSSLLVAVGGRFTSNTEED